MVLLKRVTTKPVEQVKQEPVISREKSEAAKSIDALHAKYYGKKSKKEKVKVAVEKKVAIIKKKEVATKKPTIEDTWHATLHASVGTNRTDKIIVELMEKACPGHKYTEASVSAHRSGYNSGRYSIQKGVKPAVRLEKYEVPAVKGK